MIIRAIRLENVRRFTDPVEITGMGPGLNVLAAPNERGKSTIFDALHAVFFKDAKSWDKDIRALAPRVGGEPWIEVEIELEDQVFRLAKQFRKASGKGALRIWQGDSLYLQSDAGEAWLQALIKSPKDGGPAGLLWVRQGLTDFADAKETLAARQDLMSSVAGEVDSITGGQRMDAIRRDVRQSLDRLVTLRGAKKGGALEQAMTALADYETREQALAAQVQELRHQLDQRQDLRRALADLQDPQMQQEQETRLRQSQKDLAAAQQHQEKLQVARQGMQNAELLLDSHLRALAQFQAQQQDCSEAETACQTAAETRARIAADLDPVRQRLAQAEAAHREAEQASRVAETRLAALQRAERHAQAAGQRRALQQTLAQARSAMQQITRQNHLATTGPDADALAEIETTREALALAQQAQQLAAPAITVTYEQGLDGLLLLEGAPLVGGQRLSLPTGGRLTVPGLAQIDLHPGADGGQVQLDQAERALRAALEQAGCSDVEQARQAHRARQEAAIRLQEAKQQLAALAPDGILALMQQLDALPTVAEPEAGETPPVQGSAQEIDTAEADLLSCRGALERSAAEREAARSQEGELRRALEGAQAHHQAAQQRLQRAEAALAGQGDMALRLVSLQQHQAELEQGLATRKVQYQLLEQQAPNLEQAQARAARAKSEQASTREAVQSHLRDLAVLDSRIATSAGAAVEEDLAELRDQVIGARKRLEGIEFEVAVLRRLELALERARSAAQEAYIGPVLKELQPLLRLLWPEARLALDAGQVLPDQLQRAGQEEAFDSLSGGTREQVALLVRLAFARLLARRGQPAPIILDDAIVYTDDARIEKIFDALTLQANEMQILVFTCRQKSFRALGGTQLSIRRVTR